MGLVDRFRIEGRVAAVTGSGQGIGRGIAVGLAEAGADLVLNARRVDDLEQTADLVRATGRRAVFVPGDVRDDGLCDRIAGVAIETFGRLDIWVNNVGGSDAKTLRTLVDTPDDVWRSQLELNLTSAFLGSKAAAQRMSEGGCIINISSGAGMRPSPLTGPYAAAKAGLLNLTITMAAELAERRIRVNAVSPGQVPTEAFHEVLGMTDDDLARLAEATPLGRLGTPEDIAGAVLYLASDAGSWVTGQNILVAGGRTQRGGSSQRYG